MNRSQFELFRDIAAYLYTNRAEALRFAMDKVARPDPLPNTHLERPVDDQLSLELPRRGWRT